MFRPLSALAALLLLASALPSTAPGLNVPTWPGGEVPDVVVLRFADGIPADADAWLGSHGAVIETREPTLGFIAAKFPSAGAADAFLARDAMRGDVRWAEKDGYASIAGAPNDPRYAEQWGYPAIFAEQAWDITLGSHAVKVAVVDTGVRVTHEDLAPNMCGPFVSTVPGSPDPNDTNGHGTHVAGTIAAVTNNGIGVAGTAQACIMSARVLSGNSGQWSWIAAGAVWAANNGADIISMSLQGGFTQVMQDAVRYAYNTKGVLVVSAAGNWGCSPIAGLTNEGTVAYPGRFDESMAVAALENPGVLTAVFSSCGRDMEIAGPGQDVLSTVPGGYASYSGTSMATPHVSGVAALVMDQNPGISAVALRCLLDLSADDLPALPGRDGLTGWGKLNALRALAQDRALQASGGYAAFEQACLAGAQAIFY